LYLKVQVFIINELPRGRAREISTLFKKAWQNSAYFETPQRSGNKPNLIKNNFDDQVLTCLYDFSLRVKTQKIQLKNPFFITASVFVSVVTYSKLE
jgi:hypothetical protein